MPLPILVKGNHLWGSTRAVFFGGYTGTVYNIIEYVTVEISGNATDFGDLTQEVYQCAACGSSVRGIRAGGYAGSANTDTIDYITIATIGNASDFGNLSVSRRTFNNGASSNTRGIFIAGQGPTNVIDYVTIATTGDASDFGDATASKYGGSSCSSPTRAICGGKEATASNVIDYVTIATTGNASDFGDLTVVIAYPIAISSGILGLIAGGYNGSSTFYVSIDYVTIATTGNASDFGDLMARADSTTFMGGAASHTRGLFVGGGGYNVIQFIGLSGLGNASDFGDLTVGRRALSGTSSNHGGIE